MDESVRAWLQSCWANLPNPSLKSTLSQPPHIHLRPLVHFLQAAQPSPAQAIFHPLPDRHDHISISALNLIPRSSFYFLVFLRFCIVTTS